MQERKFTSCQQNLATALQQVQDSECALQQVVSTLNEKVKALAGKDERFVLFLESFWFLKLFISLKHLEQMLRVAREEFEVGRIIVYV